VSLLHADTALAARIDGHTALDIARMAEAAADLFPDRQSAWIEVAGGRAGYAWKGAPFNCASGLGFERAVTEEDFLRIEDFYAERGEGTTIITCPLAHPSLLTLLGTRGYVPLDMENVLVMSLQDGVPPEAEGNMGPGPEVEVHVCADDERDDWARIAAEGFADDLEPTQAEYDTGFMVAHRPEAILLLATVDGELAGTGEVLTGGGVGYLSGDATLLRFRGKGVQTALQRERLRIAAQAGCDIALTESKPGSPSQRNQERRGFRVAYTRFEVHRSL